MNSSYTPAQNALLTNPDNLGMLGEDVDQRDTPKVNYTCGGKYLI